MRYKRLWQTLAKRVCIYPQKTSSQSDVHYLYVYVIVYVVCVYTCMWIATYGAWMKEQETGTQGQCVICLSTPGR